MSTKTQKTTTKQRKKVLILFDAMIADMEANKLKPLVPQLFMRGRKLNISLAFISQSYFAVPKNVRLNVTHYFIMKRIQKRYPTNSMKSFIHY